MNRKRSRVRIIGAATLGILLAAGISFWRMNTYEYHYSLEVMQVERDGYGYKIYEGNRPIIYQPFIPEVTGKKSFRTQKEAERVGHLVLERVRQKQNFSISENDLKRLGIDME